GQANILDLTLLVAIILDEINLDEYEFWHMNVDYNDQLNIIDIVQLVALILNM
ncbi:uncharacterized protein METZ01_LOCUS466525, partial [marine metagenome]